MSIQQQPVTGTSKAPSVHADLIQMAVQQLPMAKAARLAMFLAATQRRSRALALDLQRDTRIAGSTGP